MKDRRPAPISGGADALVHERASATPSPVFARRSKGETHTRVATAARAPLRSLQTWFASVITHPKSATAGVASAPESTTFDLHSEDDLLRVVIGGPRLSPLEQLDIYHYAYRARLVDCLADDYPALQHALGDEGFEALARAYIEAHPSSSPSLNAFGRHMAAFASAHGGAHKDFASDLAALEWAMVEIVHAEATPALSPEHLAQIPKEHWSSARLVPSATLRVLRARYPVNAYFQAFRDDREPAIPSREASATAIYRKGFVVWRMDLTPAMTGLLDALCAGATLGDALATIERNAESAEAIAEAERNVMVWFREWVEGGFFASVNIT